MRRKSDKMNYRLSQGLAILAILLSLYATWSLYKFNAFVSAAAQMLHQNQMDDRLQYPMIGRSHKWPQL
jgi:hypothetical protein